ncbi:MAG: hypothetical protein WBP33_01280 [Saprospiraceae bacterium]|nr:hypothetical protein [Candidatus Vicinibacter proximus]
MKSILVLRASTDICGDEVGLVTSHCQLLGMKVYKEDVPTIHALEEMVEKYLNSGTHFDYIYLCTHGDKDGFETDLSGNKISISWSQFAQQLCENGILNDDTIFLLACCKGGLMQVGIDMMSVCNKINYICGVKWNAYPWDLTTGFVVFIHNLENKNAEPNYAAQKASLATDYTFVCYDRDEVEMTSQYRIRQFELYLQLGWIDSDGNWIETDPKVNENTGHAVKEKMPLP